MTAKVDDLILVKCANCGGTGRVQSFSRSRLFAGSNYQSEPCKVCKGDGKIVVREGSKRR